MNDDEFLNDRDCTPKGRTPRTDAASRTVWDHALVPEWPSRGGSQDVVHVDFARELERELARALRVVEAAKRFANASDSDAGLGAIALHGLTNAVEEWEAGR